MKMQKRLFPTFLGIVIGLAGFALRNINPIIGWGTIGFGVSHIILGLIDLIENKITGDGA